MAQYPFHHQAQEFFPDFDYRTCVGDRNIVCRMDSGPNNKVGHQQRAFSCWWALQKCGPMDLGLDMGSSKSMTPFAIHVDLFGDGKPHPVYGGGPYVSDVVYDASAVAAILPKNSFPLIVSNHSLEHMPARGSNRTEHDVGIVDILCGWFELLRQGGVLAMIIPDNAWFDVMNSDRDHRHAWSHDDFRGRVLDPFLSRTSGKLVEYDTLDNHFSFNVVVEKP